MIRLLIGAGIRLLANAVGLVVAAVVLDDMTITGAAFVVAVLIFTVVEVLVDPLLTRIALTSVPALRGGVALVTTFVGLAITAAVSDGLSISGATTWVLATLIVWLAALLAALILPLVLVKKAVDNRQSA
ncbi:phage holin family protein [Nocardioides sp. MAHUQ-72]|uniref:phage holin family protein n=1 Tax=unclassified Nocardioides TaxID=2615069 RepID=UPI00360D17D3